MLYLGTLFDLYYVRKVNCNYKINEVYFLSFFVFLFAEFSFFLGPLQNLITVTQLVLF